MSVGSTNGDNPVLRLRPGGLGDDGDAAGEEGEVNSSPTVRDQLYTPEQVATVVAMGFPEALAREILQKRGGDVGAALDDLLGSAQLQEVMDVEGAQEAIERERKEMAEAMRLSLEEAQTRQEVEAADALVREQEESIMSLFPNSSVLNTALKDLPEEVLASEEVRGPMLELLRLEENSHKWYGRSSGAAAERVALHFAGVGRGIAEFWGMRARGGGAGPSGSGGADGGGGEGGRKRKPASDPPGGVDRGKGKAVAPAPPAEEGDSDSEWGAGGEGALGGAGVGAKELAAHVAALSRDLSQQVLGFNAAEMEGAGGGQYLVPAIFRPAAGEEAAARRSSSATAAGNGAQGSDIVHLDD